MENSEITTAVQAEVQNVNVFGSKDQFEHIQRVAAVFSKSELVPKKYQGNAANCIIALEIANRIGASPLMVMQNLDVIMGKPSWSSKFLIASVNACGKFSPLRYEEDEQEGGRTRAWAYDKGTKEKLYGAWVSMNMAKAEGWIDKAGSKWKTMPELMRRYRAASFFTNQFAPEVSMGLQTSDEVQDVEIIETKSNTKEASEKERIDKMLADCKTVFEVQDLQVKNPDLDIELFKNRIKEIGGENDK